jgi:hypothetical protein
MTLAPLLLVQLLLSFRITLYLDNTRLSISFELIEIGCDVAVDIAVQSSTAAPIILLIDAAAAAVAAFFGAQFVLLTDDAAAVASRSITR